MTALHAVFVIVIVQLPQARSMAGGTTEQREVFGRVGVGDPFWERAEYWFDSDLVVVLSKSPTSCSAHTIEVATKWDPEVWFNNLRFLDADMPESPAHRKVLTQKPVLMLVQSPGGASCGWRLLPRGGEGWTWVPEMKGTRVVGSCSDALDALKKLGVSKESNESLRASLGRPRSMAECDRAKNRP